MSKLGADGMERTPTTNDVITLIELNRIEKKIDYMKHH